MGYAPPNPSIGLEITGDPEGFEFDAATDGGPGAPPSFPCVPGTRFRV